MRGLRVLLSNAGKIGDPLAPVPVIETSPRRGPSRGILVVATAMPGFRAGPSGQHGERGRARRGALPQSK